MATKQKPLTKSAYDCKHVKSVRAWGLLFDGAVAGRVVADYSDNPAGSVCTATISIWRGPLRDMPITTGKAGGFVYCKFSAAVSQAMCRAGQQALGIVSAGPSAVMKWFEALGYVVVEVI